MKITPKFFSLLTLTLTFILSTGLSAKSMKEIDAAIEASLKRFTTEIQGGDTYLEAARGILVIPRMWKAGVLLGFEFGEGALIVDGIKIQYYKALTTSFGLQVGVGSKDLIIIFFDDTAMDNFLYSSGWGVGFEVAVEFFLRGAVGAGNKNTFKDRMVGFVLGRKGLLAGCSRAGTNSPQICHITATMLYQKKKHMKSLNETLTM